MAFVYAYFFSDFLCFDMSLLLLTVTLRGVSNKHCLLSFFSFHLKIIVFTALKNCSTCILHRRIIVMLIWLGQFFLAGSVRNHKDKFFTCNT